eukprot:Polyplicarium_translucidae@DN5587_c0_g1_i1.p1
MHRAMRMLQQWQAAQDQRMQASVIGHISASNDVVLAAFNRVPKDRACFVLGLALRTMRANRMRYAIDRIKGHTTDKVGAERSCAVIFAFLTRVHHKRLAMGLVGFATFSYRFNTYLVRRARGAMHVGFAMRTAINRSTSATFAVLRFSAE